MPNPNYRRGADRERRLADALRRGGHVVVRAAGSKGPCDIVSLRHGRIELLEVKTTPRPFATFGPAERKRLSAAAKLAGGIATLAHWPPNGTLSLIHEEDWPSG